MDEKIKRLIHELQFIRKHPKKYFTPLATPSENLLVGIFIGMYVFSDKPIDWFPLDGFLDSKKLNRHLSLVQQFMERGLNEAEAMDAVLALYIEFFEKYG